MSRARLEKGKQKDFLNSVAKHFNFDWSKIAQASNVCERTIRDWRREKYNINYETLLKLNKVSKSPLPKIINVLPEFWSAKKFARRGALRRMQLYGNLGTPEGRRKGGINSQKLFRLNPEYARKIGIIVRKKIKEPEHSEELAEFIGIMLGDGGITDYQINITLNNETDKEYSLYVQALLKKIFSISIFVLSRRLEKADRIVASGRNLVEFLEREGLKAGNKVKNQIKIPAWIMRNRRYASACLRGMIDTDGSFYSYKHRVFNQVYYNFAMCFTSHSKPLVKSVHKVLQDLDFTPVVNTKRVYLHKKRDIEAYFKKIGTHNPKHLQKYKSYLIIKNNNFGGVPKWS